MGLFDFLKPKPRTLTAEQIRSLFDYTNVNRFFDSLDYISDPIQYYAKVPDRAKLREMYYDDEIASAVDTRMEAAISTQWTIEGGTPEVNKFIYENVKYNGQDILNFSWWAVAYGYSVFQIVYEQDQGRIWWSRIFDQPYDAFKINRLNELISVATNQKLDPYKFVHTVCKPTYYNPLGESLFAKLYYPYYFKCNGWDFYMKFLERWGSPFTHIKTDMTNDELKKTLQGLAASKRPTAVVTPKDVDILSIEASSNGSVFDQFTKAVNDRINRVVLGQTLTSSTGDTGSLALGQVHNEVRLDKKKFDCDLIRDTMQRCIDALFYINGFTGDIPQFIFVDPKGMQKELADRDRVLKDLGVSFNDKYFEEIYDLDPNHFEVKETVTGFGFDDQTMFKDMGLKKHSCKFIHADDPMVKSQVSLENEMIELSQNSFSKEELRAAIKSATSEKDLQEKLAILMEKDSGNFEQVLTKALYMAKIKGFVDGKDTV